MKRRARAVAIKRVQTALSRNNVKQTSPVLVTKNFYNLLETIVDFPSSSFAPDDLIAVADDGVGFNLIPRQRECIAFEIRKL